MSRGFFRAAAAASLVAILAAPVAAQTSQCEPSRPTTSAPLYDPAMLVEYLKPDHPNLRNESGLTREILVEEVAKIELPESYPLTEPLESYQSLERAALTLLFTMDNADRLGLDYEDRSTLFMSSTHFGAHAPYAYNAITDAFNNFRWEFGTAYPDYAQRAYELGKTIPSLIDAVWERSEHFVISPE